jgi:predicted ATP-grasp superfamily ATP-dependent carboligase
LVGLNSLDLLVEEDRVWILEVNPRPGASLDALDGIGGRSLWRLHCAAVDGTLPVRTAILREDRVHAAAILYAPVRIVVPPTMAWPEWCSDRGAPGTVIAPEEPVVTVHAIAAGVAAARALAEARAEALLAKLAEPHHAREVSGGERGRETALAQRQ